MGESDESVFEAGLHGFIGDVVHSVLDEFSFGFDETEEEMLSDEESTETESTGNDMHFTIKCTDVSKPADKLYEDKKASESSDSALDDENEELVNIIILDGFEIEQKVMSVVTFSGTEACKTDAKISSGGRATSHHMEIGRTSSFRKLFNRVFNRSKSATERPLYKERTDNQEKTDNSKSKKKKNRFFKRTKQRADDTQRSSIEVTQGGADISVQNESKIIAGFFAKKASKFHEEDNSVDSSKPTRISLSRLRNSLINVFRNRPIIV